MSKIIEILLGQFIVKEEVMTLFILKADGLVYLRAPDGHEEEPITVKQFMDGMGAANVMLDAWRKSDG